MMSKIYIIISELKKLFGFTVNSFGAFRLTHFVYKITDMYLII